MRHISEPISEILDELEKRLNPPADADREPVRRIRQGDLDAQAIYLELTNISKADAAEIDRLTRRKAVIDQIRGAIFLGRGRNE